MVFDNDLDDQIKLILKEWLDNKDVGEGLRERLEKVIEVFENDRSEIGDIILVDKEFLIKRF